MFENVQAEINSDLESSADESQSNQQTQNQESAPSIFELDKAEKVKYNGQEWSVKDLFSGTLRHSDYTRKTQELAKQREEFGNTKKYYDALQADIDAVEKNPQLLAKFKEVYPPQFHWLADRLFGQGNQAGQSQEKSTSQVDIENHPAFKSVLEKVNSWESQNQEKLVEAYQQKLDVTFKQLSEKYPFANEESVIQRAIALRDANQNVDEKVLEKIAKDLNDKTYALIDKKYKEQTKTQLQKGRRGEDIASGGGIPGPAPQGRRGLKDAINESLASFME